MGGSLGEKRNAHSVLVGRPEANRLLERTNRRWKDVDRIYLAQGPQAGFCEHASESSEFVKC
jgi:hypothetical protein